MILRQTRAEINLENLAHNYKVLKGLHGKRHFFCPMIKANAYGHGDVEVARKLEKLNCQFFGVVLVEEGIHLRKSGIKTEILVFGTYTEDSMQQLLEHNLTAVISDFSQLEILLQVAKTRQTKIHLKFNTGMNRLGFSSSDTEKIRSLLDQNKNISIEGVCTHFLKSEDADQKEGYTEAQYDVFKKIKNDFIGLTQYFHCLNSGALLLSFQNKKDPAQVPHDFGARPGISLYGINTTQNQRVDLHPVMSVKSIIAQIHEVKKGEVASYGATWKAERDTLLATVPIGYADGYSRDFSNKGEMLFRRKRVPVRGIVCMDYTIIDITPLKNEKKINLGEEVVVFGEQDGASFHSYELANKCNKSPYEIVTRMSERVPRIYVG